MDSEQLRVLIRQGESASLDFKARQYAFTGADDDDKSELLKDVLAFANSWRTETAHILIGVEDSNGTPRLVGIPLHDHIDDAKLQQFINSKTNRNVDLSYRVVDIDGVSVGVISIPLQSRPTYATRPCGRVKVGQVYYRRGSSTTLADPDDIHQMGRDDQRALQDAEPALEVSLADIDGSRVLGSSIDVQQAVFVLPDAERLPDFGEEGHESRSVAPALAAIRGVLSWTRNNPRPDYWRDLGEYVSVISRLARFGLAIHNRGSVAARDVRLELAVDGAAAVVWEPDQLPKRPRPYTNSPLDIMAPSLPMSFAEMPRVSKQGSRWVMTFERELIRPGEVAFGDQPLFLGVKNTSVVEIVGRLYASNVRAPHAVELSIDVTVEKKPLGMDDLEADHERFTENTVRDDGESEE